MINLNQEETEFLKKYIDTPTPSGHEQEGQKLWLEYIKPYINQYFVDVTGSVAGILNPEKKYKVLIEAHVDQVSYYVNYISKEGFIYVTKIGGADPVIAPSKHVRIHTRKGDVPGFFGWPAVHVRNSNQERPTIDKIFIETGCSSKKQVLDLGIDIGCPITYGEPLKILNNSIVVGPALDNKIGGFIIAQVLKKIFEAKKELPFALYVVNSVLEETGKLGATIMGNIIKPDVAVITDVTHDTQSPMYDKKQYGDIHMGKGPVLSFAPTVQKNLLDMLLEVANNSGIPYQKKASSKSTGTDTDAFFSSDSGVASALVALPLRYMHTTVETASLHDIENAIDLMFQFLIQLPANHEFHYFK